MRIGIDISSTMRNEKTGVEEYTYQVVKHMTRLPEARQHELVFYAPEGKTYFWHERKLPLLIKKTSPDVFWSPSNPLPIFLPKVKKVITIHGLEWLRCPKSYSLRARLYLSLRTVEALKRANGVITVSERSKEGLLSFFNPLPPIAIIHHGAPKCVPTQKREGLPRHILFLGRKDKRKNIPRMLKAFYRLASIYQGEILFTLAGPAGNDRFVNNLKGHTFKNATVKNLPYFLSSEEKEQLLKGADVLILASLDEGFGMPILEAQAAGTPVVASSFLKEVAGAGALYCEPQDPESIARALYQLISDKNLYKKQRELGLQNCQKFSWDKTAVETLKFITSIT